MMAFQIPRAAALAVLLGLTALLGWSGSAAPPAAPTTLIANVILIDGTGASRRKASVRIRGDRIAAVGALKRLRGERVVDGGGLVLAPGFIDTHSHHDRGLLENRESAVLTSQGVTTIVVGQDGRSDRPLAEYFGSVEAAPPAVNLASYVGHGTLRAEAMGEDYRRRATPREVERMKALLAEEMRAGALGLSSGLEYDPGIYASTEELVALARTAARFGGRYISHIRSEDRELWKAVDELIEIGRKARLPVQLSHAKLAMVDWWSQAPRLITKLEDARRSGVEVTADIYPYEYWQSTLTVLFPERNFRDRKAAEFALKSLAPAEGLRLSRYTPDPSLVGKTVAEIARARGTDPAHTLMDLIAAAPKPGEQEMVIGTSMRADDIEALIRWPHSNICSDGMIEDRHPRGAGSFARILRHYVRERRTLTLEQAVHKMSGLSAAHMGLSGRGTIRPGNLADLILFDPARVADHATIENPGARSTGIERVWVNGRLVFSGGRATAERPGRVLRRAQSPKG